MTGGDGYTTMWLNALLNATELSLKNGFDGKFYVYFTTYKPTNQHLSSKSLGNLSDFFFKKDLTHTTSSNSLTRVLEIKDSAYYFSSISCFVPFIIGLA